MAKRRRADFVQTLVHLDEPQLMYMKAGKSQVLAIAVDEDGYASPYLAVTVEKKKFDQYMYGSCDLRYLFVTTSSHYIFDAKKLTANGTVMMEPYPHADVSDDHLPLPQFFSNSHTEDFEVDALSNITQVFDVDGQWDLPEFAKFYNNFGDAYSFMVAVKRLVSNETPENLKRSILEAIRTLPFKGGSSYLHFFKQLPRTQEWHERLGMKRMQYASPGQVEVRGSQEGFDAINRSLSAFSQNRKEVIETYKELHGYMSKAKLLNLSAKKYDGGKTASDYLLGQSSKLAAALNLEEFDTVKFIADNNSLVIAKITLAVTRRIKSSYEFFAQGRVSMDDVEALH